MAKRVKKKDSIDVQSFGGVQEMGKAKLNEYDHDVSSIEVTSKTNVASEVNEGKEVIVRRFTFGINPQAFKEAQPSKQMIFNSHIRGIEMALWRDGMKVMDEVEPRITFDTENMQYHIFVGARPMKGHLITQQPQSLREIIHGV